MDDYRVVPVENTFTDKLAYRVYRNGVVGQTFDTEADAEAWIENDKKHKDYAIPHRVELNGKLIKEFNNYREAYTFVLNLTHNDSRNGLPFSPYTIHKNVETVTVANNDVINTAGSLLAEAAKIVEGSRQQTHGQKERSFDAIAQMWTAYIQQASGRMQLEFTPTDVAHMMVLLKMVRATHGEAKSDHWIDMAGYAGLAGELALKGKS